MSVEPKFTPGPWTLELSRDVFDPFPYTIAFADGSGRCLDQNWSRADAHLTAAAPDLFLCAEILAGLESDDGGRTFPTKQDCQFARGALSKALSPIAILPPAKSSGSDNSPTSPTPQVVSGCLSGDA